MGSDPVTLTAPNGMQVSVPAEKADRLKVNGYKPVDEKPAAKAPAKKASASRKSDK